MFVQICDICFQTVVGVESLGLIVNCFFGEKSVRQLPVGSVRNVWPMESGCLVSVREAVRNLCESCEESVGNRWLSVRSPAKSWETNQWVAALKDLWETNEKPVRKLGETCEKAVRNLWESCEKPMRQLCEKPVRKVWETCAKALRSLWDICEKVVRNLWETWEKHGKTFEKPVRNLWESCEKPMRKLCEIHGKAVKIFDLSIEKAMTKLWEVMRNLFGKPVWSHERPQWET